MNRISIKRDQIAAVFEALRRQGTLDQLMVQQIMTPRPHCVPRNETVYGLVKLIHAYRFRHLLVTEENRLVGVISDRDITLCFDFNNPPTADQLKRITADQLMSTDLVTVGPRTLLLKAIHLMLDCGINCLPVVVARQPIGVITSTDLFLTLEQLLTDLPLPHPSAPARGERP